MSTSQAKARAIPTAPLRPQPDPALSDDSGATQLQQFSAIVGAIAQRYGVKVAAVPAPTKNPYAMSTEQAENIALQAGIITRAGALTSKFK